MKVDEIRVLNIDDQAYAVDMMSDKVKRLVAIFNEWAQQEVDANDRLAQIQCAKQELSRQIVAAVREEVSPKEDEASVPAAE